MSEDKKSERKFAGRSWNPAEIEEAILKFWEENKIFEKTLDKTKDGEPFTFYDGPPFATGTPHYGHLLASTIKDLIPRYQTMRGRFVRRRWGWDCHGLPIEEIVERKLKISGKKQIEEIGVQKFNETCRSMVLTFVDEWRKMIRRLARWTEFDNSYKTMDRDYMESVWWAFKKIYDRGLVYEGRKVLMYCPRCETPVSNFEVAMDNSYKTVTEEAVTVKFKIKSQISNLKTSQPVYLLAWTTTPWTLPGNVALAVGEDIDYAAVGQGEEIYIVARNRLSVIASGSEAIQSEQSGLPRRSDGAPRNDIIKELKGKYLIGLEYEPLFDVPEVKSEKTHRVYAADFVTTEEGTGIVHTAVVYGEDDYQLGLREGLPVVPLLDEKGKFNDKAPELVRGMYFKEADQVVIADLEKRGLLSRKEKNTHSYPHCWRCGNPLFYNALPSWFINIQKIKSQLLATNEREINWFPAHLKRGRYAKSVEVAPDWNISRNRYWGNPIPVWKCAGKKSQIPISNDQTTCGNVKVVGSIKELGLERNTFYFTRHGEAESNVRNVIATKFPEPALIELTAAGVNQADKLGEKLKAEGGLDLIIASDFERTKRTAEIIAGKTGAPVEFDARLREYNTGVWDGRPVAEYNLAAPAATRWTTAPEGGETWMDLQNRLLDFIRETNQKYTGKKILIVSHGDPLWILRRYFGSDPGYPTFAEVFELSVSIADLHRPYIDEIVLPCEKCGGEMRRVTEIFDSWMEAGSMPFAEYHYPFDNKGYFPPLAEAGSPPQVPGGKLRLPGQFVAEYIAQTRAWFYVMHVVSQIIFGKAPFENVVTTGTILAEDGTKMSKSKGNYPDPWLVLEKYGTDSLRFYLMNSVVMQAENLNFSEREVNSIHRKIVLILWNVFNYFDTYAKEHGTGREHGTLELTPLDKWINARTQELVNEVTARFDEYDTVRATRAMAAYVDDLSTWYLRRSRSRGDAAFLPTLCSSLLTVTKVIAPVMPYVSEMIYQNIATRHSPLATRNNHYSPSETRDPSGEAPIPESVHLADWPAAQELSAEQKDILRSMEVIREAASVGLALRKLVNLPVRQPLPRLAFFTGDEIAPSAELMNILLSELNVKRFDPALSAEESEHVKTAAGEKHILNLYLDVALTPELVQEGLARQMERFVQEIRKTQGLQVGEMARLYYATGDRAMSEAAALFDRKKTYVKEILAGKGSGEARVLETDHGKIAFELEKI